MTDIILPDVSLCAIVRDEMMNPAWGIVDYVESTLPYVEEGLIVDTGSVDGTREALEELEAKYPNLTVLDTKFRGFAYSRNSALQSVRTRKALVLDADERLTREDFRKLKEGYFDRENNDNLGFEIMHIDPEGKRYTNEGIHNPRLFLVDGKHYEGKCWEKLFNRNGDETPWTQTRISVKHFVPDLKGCRAKFDNWYDAVVESDTQFIGKRNLTDSRLHLGLTTPPSKTKDFHRWKQPNRFRPDYR